MANKTEVLEQWLSDCEPYVETSRLTQWESDFITSVRDQFDRTGHLSEKQQEILERIYAEKIP